MRALTKPLFGAIAVALVIAAAVTSMRPGHDVFVRAYDHVLGTSLDVKVLAASAEVADDAAGAVVAEIDRLDAILSGYRDESEFRRWMETRDTAVPVSADLFTVLQQFDRWRERTGGALDAAAETIAQVWRDAEAANRLPDGRDVADAVARVRLAHWRLDAGRGTATRLTAAPLMLNSFAKGYVVERAAEAGLRVPGTRGIIVNIGGDLAVRGAMTETVAIRDPESDFENAAPLMRIAVRDRAVATSGSYRRGFEIQGAHYSHILDPRTGSPAGHVLSATVVAPRAVDAGALATALCVLAPEESARIVRQAGAAEYLLVLAGGRRVESPGWRSLSAAPPASGLPGPIAALEAAEQGAWDPAFALTVSVTIGSPPGNRKRPYVVVWIEDANRRSVRTLEFSHLLTDPTWDYKLTEWMQKDRERMAAGGPPLLASVSSATRAPGVYKLTWDGKDDAGKFVPAGTYMVLIEGKREGGDYFLMRQSMEFAGVPKQVDLEGNPEIPSASLDYHRVRNQ